MKCLIPGLNVKIVGRAVQALARVGDELYVEALQEGLVLRALSPAEAAYGAVTFQRPFFSYYSHLHAAAPDQPSLKCKIAMRSALSVFRSPGTLDKQVEMLEIRLDASACKLLFQLRCRHGIVRTHFLSILDCKKMEAVFTRDLVPNRLMVQHKVLSDAVGNFQSTEDQMTLQVTPKTFLVRNYPDAGDTAKIIRTQLSLLPVEFDSYRVGCDTVITFSMREFRAVLTFAESVNLPIEIQFETMGKPVVFIISNNTTFETTFVMATERANTDTQETSSTCITNVKTNQKRNSTTDLERAPKRQHVEKENNFNNLDEDSHLFEMIEMPDETIQKVQVNVNEDKVVKETANGNHVVQEEADGDFLFEEAAADEIPGSPIANTQVRNIKTVFKRCFEATFNPATAFGAHAVLAEDSDCDSS